MSKASTVQYIQKFEFDFPAEKYIVLQKPRNNSEKNKNTVCIYYIGTAAHIPSPPRLVYR